MRKVIQVIAAALALLCVSGCSLVQVNKERVIVAQVGNEKITLMDFLIEAVPYLNDNEINPYDTAQKETVNYIEDSVIEWLINNKIYEIKMAEYGLVEEESDREQAQRELDEYFESYRKVYYDSYMVEYPDAPVEEVEIKTQEYMDQFFSETYTMENYIEDKVAEIVSNKLYDKMTQDITVEESEVQAKYDEHIAADKETYAADPSAYDIALDDGTAVYYKPEGAFYVQHILLRIPTEKLDEITALRGEDKDEEANDVRAEALTAIQEHADEVLAKVDTGEDFMTLMDEYGEDTGLKYEPARTTGYMVYEGHTSLMEEFLNGALALTEDGQTSSLVVTDYGYHIIKRVSTITPGPVPYDEAKDAIAEEVLTQKKNEAFQLFMEQWKEELKVQIWKKRIDYQ